MSESSAPLAAYILRPSCLPGVELVQYVARSPGTRFVAPWYSAAVLRGGEGVFRHQGRELPCPRQAAILISPGELFLACHRTGADGEAALAATHLQVAGEVVARAYEEAGGRGALHFPITPRDGRALGDGMLALEQRLRLEPASALAAQQAFTRWLELLLRNAETPPAEPTHLRERRALAWARELLHERLEQEFGLDELAAEVGLNKAYLVRAFKRELGIPPHEYQMQLRVAHARRLLARGLPATQAAHAAGFYDQSHLTRWFKKVVGVTPGAYAHAVR